MSETKDTEIGKEYDDLSVDELKEELRIAFLQSDDEIGDDTMDKLDKLMAALREKEPLDHERSAEEAWEAFQQDHREELSPIGVRNQSAMEVMPSQAEFDRKMVRRSWKLFLRIGLVAAIVIVILFAVTAVASASGFNLWGWIPKWNSEDLRFATEAPEVVDTHGIQSALAELGITESVYPTWIPEDLMCTIVVFETNPVFLHEFYSDNDRMLYITIVPSSGSDTAVYQRDDTVSEEYIAGGTIHYIFCDIDQYSAVWYTENYTVSVSGNITLLEMKRIIDSVYEVSR